MSNCDDVCVMQHSMRLAAGSEEGMMSTESLAHDAENESATNLPVAAWVSSVKPAYYNGQLVAVKHIKKPFVTLTKTVVAEVNQVIHPGTCHSTSQ